MSTEKTAYSALDIFQRIVKVSFPLLVSNATFAVMLFCDRTMLAHYKLQAASASLGAGVISFTVQCFFMGVAQYTATMVAQYFGAKDKRMVSVSVWQSLYFVILVGLLVPLATQPMGLWILKMANHSPEILEMEKTYYSYMAFFMIVPLVNITLSAFFNGRSMVWISTVSNIVGCCCNVFLNYVLIFGHFGCPALGISGAAIATILAGLCTTAFFVALIVFMPSTKEYRFFKEWRFRKTSFMNLLRFGIPTGLMFGLENAAFAVQVMFTGRISDDALNATTITFSIQNLIFLPLLSVGAGAGIVLAQFIGMNRKQEGRRAVRQGLWLSAGVLTLIGIFIVLFTREIFNLFCGGQHPESVYVMTRNLLYWMMLYNFFDVVNIGLNNALRSAGDTMFTMVFSLVMNWLFYVPALYVATEVLHMGVYSIWSIMGVMFAIYAVAYWIRFERGKWEQIKVMEDSDGAAV